MVRYSITKSYETILHIAVSTKNTERGEILMEYLVREMRKEDLKLQNENRETALSLAVAAGNVKMVEILVKRDEALLDIPDRQGMMPLYIAALYGKQDLVKYLYDNSQCMNGRFWTNESRARVLLACVEAELFEVALQIVTDCPKLAICGSVLRVLARKPNAFKVGTPQIFSLSVRVCFLRVGTAKKETSAMLFLRVIWTNILKLPKSKVDDILRGPPDHITEVENPNNAKQKYSSRALFVAAEMGNTAFIVELIRRYPGLVWEVNDNNQSIFHIAVLHRHESLYNLLYEIGSFKDSIISLEDKDGNNMLHLAGILREPEKNKLVKEVRGVVLQMKRELLWFKEIKAILPVSFREKKNAIGLTPKELFTNNHKDLVSKGEEWMKTTGSQLMVVAALIATITFAAAITFPGGYNQETGNPWFLKNPSFTAFLLFDAVSFISASTSIHAVLTILTTRYDERDFFMLLPTKLMLTLGTLYISITSMFIAFGINFFVLYEKKSKLIPVTICLLIFVVNSVTDFSSPFVVYIYSSLSGQNSTFNRRKGILYCKTKD